MQPKAPTSPQHPPLYSNLDLRDVEEAGRVADERTAREGEFGDGLQAALGQGARAVLQAGPPSSSLVMAGWRLNC